MTLREKQSAFLLDVARLILWAYEQGYELTSGELQRTEEQQILYYKGYSVVLKNGKVSLVKADRKSDTMNSQHLKKLAVDLNLFINGKYITDGEKYKPLADYWKSLNPANVAGYDWGWDFGHFEMK
jgi:hypothetical protein